jgi:predicted AAA+ superfamily ATPase
VEVLAAYYQQFGTGLFAQYRAFRWQSGQLSGIINPDPIEVTHLASYESQKAALVKNTEFLLAGYSALHVLLYGSRGTGKSSLVKGLLNQYSSSGLRLIEVSKSDLKDLSIIVEQLRDVPQKFIIFVDDLSFEEDDDAFKALKVVLEGSVTARSQNVVVYATSNRRHLIREFFEDRPRPREGDEVHAWDTVQEKLSFSDRFGLTLTFEPANQDSYLEIVQHLAQHATMDVLEGLHDNLLIFFGQI